MRESERARFCVFEEVKSRPYSIPVGIAALEEGYHFGFKPGWVPLRGTRYSGTTPAPLRSFLYLRCSNSENCISDH